MVIDGTAASKAQTSKMLSSLSDLRAKLVERIDMLTAALVSPVSEARIASRLVEMVCCTTGLAACYFHVIKPPDCALRVSVACVIISNPSNGQRNMQAAPLWASKHQQGFLVNPYLRRISMT
jgi:hypothetical protein